jgi:hypothetical protein
MWGADAHDRRPPFATVPVLEISAAIAIGLLLLAEMRPGWSHRHLGLSNRQAPRRSHSDEG